MTSKECLFQHLESPNRQSDSVQADLESGAEQPSKPHHERAKIVISIQDKDEVKQFRVYKVHISKSLGFVYKTDCFM